MSRESVQPAQMSTAATTSARMIGAPHLSGCIAALIYGLATVSLAGDGPKPNAAAQTPRSVNPSKANQSPSAHDWISLFDGRTLKGWKTSDFGKGGGSVEAKNGELRLGVGKDLTGVTIDQPIPRMNYEVSLEAKRVEGSDFFCGLTFPVKEDPCSLILGGWGGGVCGLSSIDGSDASENNTSSYRKFENGRWYAIRLKVTDAKIEAWIDKEQIIDQELNDHSISIRLEVEPSKPFGLATWRTGAALRNIRVRRLK
jgi:hypothetical protein